MSEKRDVGKVGCHFRIHYSIRLCSTPPIERTQSPPQLRLGVDLHIKSRWQVDTGSEVWYGVGMVDCEQGTCALPEIVPRVEPRR